MWQQNISGAECTEDLTQKRGSCSTPQAVSESTPDFSWSFCHLLNSSWRFLPGSAVVDAFARLRGRTDPAGLEPGGECDPPVRYRAQKPAVRRPGAGARASANLDRLVETAKTNRIEPWTYLRHVFDELPRAISPDEIDALLRQNVDPALIRQPASTTSFAERTTKSECVGQVIHIGERRLLRGQDQGEVGVQRCGRSDSVLVHLASEDDDAPEPDTRVLDEDVLDRVDRIV